MTVPAQLEQHDRIKAIRARDMAMFASRDRSARERERVAGILAQYRKVYDSGLAIARIPNRIAAAALGSKSRVRAIQKEVASASEMTTEELLSYRRTKHVALARSVAIWLARRDTTLSMASIGGMFSGRDHTTVIYACRRIDRMIADGTLPEEFTALVEGRARD